MCLWNNLGKISHYLEGAMRETLLTEKLQTFVSDKNTLSALRSFADFFLLRNETVSLSAITEEEDVAVKHFADSLTAVSLLPQGARVLDIGSGCGFPAVPLAIARQDASFVLLDSVQKKTAFLADACAELGLKNITVRTERAEVLAHGDERASFDVVTARAVSALRVLTELAVPFLKTGGILIAYKGSSAEQEITDAAGAFAALNCAVRASKPFLLDDKYERTLVVIEKLGDTPAAYPRKTKRIKTAPL